MIKPLVKTTLVIWSESPVGSLQDLAREATDGNAYCSVSDTVVVQDPASDPDWDGTEFFDDPSNSDEELAEEEET